MKNAKLSPHLEIHNLAPDPKDEWRRLLKFGGLSAVDYLAMSRSGETCLEPED
jgi:hypothetical protein